MTAITPIRPQPFDYSTLPQSDAERLQAAADEIRGLVKTTAASIVEIGRRLDWAECHLSAIRFRRWVESELGWRLGQAEDYIRVFRRFGDMNLVDAHADPRALFSVAWMHPESEGIQEVRQILVDKQPLTAHEARDIRRKHGDPPPGRPVGWKRTPSTTPPTEVIERVETPAEHAVRNLQVALAECYGVPLRSPVARALDELRAIIGQTDA